MATSGLEYQLLQGQTPCKDINKFKPVSKIQKSLRQLCQNADNASKQSNRENYEQCAKKCLGNCGLDLSGFLMCLKNYVNIMKNVNNCWQLYINQTECDNNELIEYFLETIHKNKATNATVAYIWNVVRYMYNIIPQQST